MTPAESEQLAAKCAAKIYADMIANVDSFWDHKIEYGEFHARQGELWFRATAAGVVRTISDWIAGKTRPANLPKE